MTLLIVDRLTKRFGPVTAARDVTFELAPGEVLALTGPSGAGKTTVLDMLGGQLRPDSGRIRLGDEDVTRAGPRALYRLGVGRTFQATATFASMTVRENVQTAIVSTRDETALWWRPTRRRQRSRADHLLQRVGLLDQAERGATALSPGDLRLLDLALALAHRPRLLLLDEPAADLPPAGRATLAQLIRDLVTSEEIAVLLTQRHTDPGPPVADRILALDAPR